MSRPLGSDQKGLLRTLVEHYSWHGDGWGCGWNWSTPAKTGKILESLVKRGLVEKTEEKFDYGHRKGTHTIYRASEAGQQLVAQWKQERAAARAAAEGER